MPEVVIDFFPNGTVKVEAVGYTGTSCEDATAFLKGLGTEVDKEYKPEYYDEAEEHIHAR
jgi:hypothetical protein